MLHVSAKIEMLSAKNWNVKCKIEMLHPKEKRNVTSKKWKEMLTSKNKMLTSKNRNVNVQKIEMFSPNLC